MELKQFIKEALLNITEGVEEANRIKDRFKIIGMKQHESGSDGNYAEFDVSIYIDEKSSSSANAKLGTSLLNVVSAKVGSGISQSNTLQNTHRLAFKVYVSEK